MCSNTRKFSKPKKRPVVIFKCGESVFFGIVTYRTPSRGNSVNWKRTRGAYFPFIEDDDVLLLIGIWRSCRHSSEGVCLVRDLCTDYNIWEIQMWAALLQQMTKETGGYPLVKS
jgi:hypothetical protein